MSPRARTRALALALAAAALHACGSDSSAVEGGSPGARGGEWWAAAGGAPAALWLSQTGLYADIAGKLMAADVVGFEPRFQLWSDGADKRRWLRLPPGSRIDNSDPDHWLLPAGALVFKEFSREGKRLETRVVARTGPGPRDYWLGAFVWNEDESDARWVPEGLANARGTSHDVPSRKRCGTCHDGAPGRVLGLSAIQQPQLPRAGLQLAPVANAALHEPTAQAALGYLHANCAHCHNPRGSAFPDTDLDLRLSIRDSSPESTLAYRTTLHVPLQSFRRTGSRWRVLPGEPEQSALLQRVSQPEPAVRMPPLGTEQIDPAGVTLLRAWIQSLSPRDVVSGAQREAEALGSGVKP